jgi:hypothetical protein
MKVVIVMQQVGMRSRLALFLRLLSRGQKVQEPFATRGRVSQLLQTTTDLLWGPSLPRLVKDEIGDEPIPHWKATKESRLS